MYALAANALTSHLLTLEDGLVTSSRQGTTQHLDPERHIHIESELKTAADTID